MKSAENIYNSVKHLQLAVTYMIPAVTADVNLMQLRVILDCNRKPETNRLSICSRIAYTLALWHQPQLNTLSQVPGIIHIMHFTDPCCEQNLKAPSRSETHTVVWEMCPRTPREWQTGHTHQPRQQSAPAKYHRHAISSYLQYAATSVTQPCQGLLQPVLSQMKESHWDSKQNLILAVNTCE